MVEYTKDNKKKMSTDVIKFLVNNVTKMKFGIQIYGQKLDNEKCFCNVIEICLRFVLMFISFAKTVYRKKCSNIYISQMSKTCQRS